jgi:drug/metabolite transporter (DMT)-like permease
MQHHTKAYVYLLLTTAIWGGMYVFSKYVFVMLSPMAFLFYRFLLGGGILLGVFLFRGGKLSMLRVKREDVKYVLMIGLGGYFLGIGLQLLGTDYCDASLASLINSTNPVIIILIAMLILKERATKRQLFSVGCALLGTVLIIGQIDSAGSLLGAVISCGAVVFWSFGSVMVRFVSEKYDVLVVTILCMFLCAMAALPFSIYEQVVNPFDFAKVAPMFIFSFLFIVIISTALSFLMWNKALSLVSASTCSMFYPVQPLVSAILGILLLGEQLSVTFVIGGGLIVFGVLFSVVRIGGARKLPNL